MTCFKAECRVDPYRPFYSKADLDKFLFVKLLFNFISLIGFKNMKAVYFYIFIEYRTHKSLFSCFFFFFFWHIIHHVNASFEGCLLLWKLFEVVYPTVGRHVVKIFEVVYPSVRRHCQTCWGSHLFFGAEDSVAVINSNWKYLKQVGRYARRETNKWMNGHFKVRSPTVHW